MMFPTEVVEPHLLPSWVESVEHARAQNDRHSPPPAVVKQLAPIVSIFAFPTFQRNKDGAHVTIDKTTNTYAGSQGQEVRLLAKVQHLIICYREHSEEEIFLFREVCRHLETIKVQGRS